MPTYGIISDTHGILHQDILLHFSNVDAILHGGDVVGDEILEQLQKIAPTYAISGNCDYESVQLPIARVVELPFGKVGMAHGHLFSTDKEKRSNELVQFFAEEKVKIIVTGHSHSQLLDFRKGVFIVNPGAACKPRFNLQSSICVLTWHKSDNTFQFDFRPILWSK